MRSPIVRAIPMQSRLSLFESSIGEGAVYYSGSRSVHHPPPSRRTVPPKPPPGLLSLEHLCLHVLSDKTQRFFLERDAGRILERLDLMFPSGVGGTTCETTKALYAPVRNRLCMDKIWHENRLKSQSRLESHLRAEEERARKDAEAARLRREAEAAAEAREDAAAEAAEAARVKEAARLEARLDAHP